MSDKPNSQAQTRRFDAEVNQLLKLMINALYSNREIFLRELISNASDASDKLRFEALTNEALKGLDQDLHIDICFDPEAKTLTIQDHGIGMSEEELIDNLGTIAKSGTRQFLEALSGDAKQDAQLIGQFGVGFYSAFIVADRVVVETRHAGTEPETAHRWTSEGSGEYTIEPISKNEHGTTITLYMNDQHQDLLDQWQLRRIIRHYSNHIAFPIQLVIPVEEGKKSKTQEAQLTTETINEAKALWTRSKSEVSDAEYATFYTGLTHDSDGPLSWAHHQVEGSQSYSLLLYLPKKAPFDLLMNRDSVEGLKLYIQRVFIMDAAEQLLPRYLRFIRGVVDSNDLPLNVSREILQDSPLLKKIRATVVKRSLDLIEKVTDEGGDDWEKFYEAFGTILKEGIIEDFENKERLASLLRFHTTGDEQWVGLDDYVSRLKEGEDTIWYLTAENKTVAKHSPHLEAFKKKGIEVLLLTDRIDEWVVSHLHEYKGKTLKSVTTGSVDDKDAPKPKKATIKLAQRIQKVLKDHVGDVKPSHAMTDSAARVVTEAHGMSLQMQKFMRQAGQPVPEVTPNLEINPDHALIQYLEKETNEARFAMLASLLLDQALLAEGAELADPNAYVKKVNTVLVEALSNANGESA